MALLPQFVTQNPLLCGFLILLLYGFILPVTDEMAVALVGAMMRVTGTPFLPALAVAIVALLLQDTAWFMLARLFGGRILRNKLLGRIFKSKIIEEGGRYLLRRGPSLVFSSRFVVGIRSATIIGAGIFGMRWSRFALHDSLAVMIMTPAWLFVGFSLGSQFDAKVGQFTRFFAILGPVAIVVGAFLIYRSVKADKARFDAELAGKNIDTAA
jgi:membrane protein DedA with SNARE-associated domain